MLLDSPVGAPRTPKDYQPLVTALGGTLDFPAMLAIADVLPVMVAYIDRDCIYRFMNKPLAEWLNLPRKKILGHHMRDVLGEARLCRPRADVPLGLAGPAEVLRH